jgi:hypothetical protein
LKILENSALTAKSMGVYTPTLGVSDSILWVKRKN